MNQHARVQFMTDAIKQFLSEDHRRLEKLLSAAAEARQRIDAEAYGRFRAGLLRHISMEEKVLLPAAQRLRDNAPLPLASKLRLDHGALAALLVPSPTPEIIGVIRSILARHNDLEEGRDGLYDTCDRLAEGHSENLVVQMRAVPDVPVSAHNDGPKVMPAVCRALRRAGYGAEADRLE